MNKEKTGNPVVLVSAIAIQLCLGIAYIWSVFQTGIANSVFNGDNAQASLVFSLLLSVLTIGSIFGGKLAAKFSTRFVIILGGIIVSVGFFLASFVTSENSWLLWVSYGLLGGLGMGFSYSPSIACAQKWYPHRKGLVTGIIVAALGLGGVVFTPVVESLIVTFGGQGQVGVIGGEQSTFAVLAGIFLVVCTLGGLFMKDAPVTAASLAEDNSIPPKLMLKTKNFYLMLATFALACMGGLMMIGFAKPIAEAKGLAETATIGVLLISIFNAGGRLFWGPISDKLGQKKTIIILLIGTAGLSLLVNAATGYLIYVLIGCIGFFYGGFLSTFPTLTSNLFGPRYMATNYGFMLLGFGVGAVVSSQIAGYYKNVAVDDINLMFPAFVIASIAAAVGIVLMLFVKTNKPTKQK